MRRAKELVGYWNPDIMKGNYRGQEIGAAILDTGIILHPDFDSRIVGFKDFVSGRREIYDDSGHGTHVAGILAGSGKLSGGVYAGIAPEANILICKVLDQDGSGTVQDVLEGIQWIREKRREYNIRVVNISVGAQPELNNEEEKRLLGGVDLLWDEGLVVVVSAGNYGPGKGTVAVPGSSRKVITVGAAKGVVISDRKSRREWDYSGEGPTDTCVVKPDVIAPGTDIMSCNGAYLNRWKKPYVAKTGTSMAAPMVSGAVACLLSKYPNMTNVEVKLRLRETSVSNGIEGQGWGMLNMRNLMRGK